MDWKKWKQTRREEIEEDIQTKGKSYSEMISELNSLRDSTFVFFDTETMGFDPEFDQITQIGFSSVTFQDGKEAASEEEKNIYAKFTQQSLDRLKDGTEENLRWKKANEASIEKIKNNKRITDEERRSKLEFATDPYKVLRFTGMVDANNNFTREPDMSEEDVLKTFLSFVSQGNNTIIVAHNAKFDVKMVNGRAEKYGLEKLQPGQNIKEILDTLSISREQFLPALLDLKNKFVQERNSMQGVDNVSNMFSQAQKKSKEDLKASGADFHPQADIKDLSNKTIAAINNMPEEVREKMLRSVILNTLIASLDNTYQNGRSALGTLANSFKMTSAGAHDAIVDVRMMIKVYNNMYRVLQMALQYLGSGAEALTDIQRKAMKLEEEMEPYQRMVTQKHPAAKQRLTGYGKNRDKSSPYKKKLSLKRGKSAPPIG